MTRRPSAAGILTLAALLLATLADCGNGDGNTDGAAATAEAKTPAPADELAQRVLAQGDLKGCKVDKPDAKFAIAKDQKDLNVDKPACAPAAYAMNNLPIGDPQATLTREVNEKDFEGMDTSITLSSYAAGKAEAAMAELKQAVEACGDGFTAEGAETAPGYGDQSLAFAATFDVRGATQTFRTQAARFGDTVVIYFAINGSTLVRSVPGEAKVPAAVVEAQNAKLTG